MRQESTTTREGKYPQDDRSVSYAVRDGDSTNDYSSYVKKREVTEMKMCRWACGHTLRFDVRNDDTRERSRGHHREVQESKIDVVWTRQEASPIIHRK